LTKREIRCFTRHLPMQLSKSVVSRSTRDKKTRGRRGATPWVQSSQYGYVNAVLIALALVRKKITVRRILLDCVRRRTIYHKNSFLSRVFSPPALFL
jgi:hypothetical protein